MGVRINRGGGDFGEPAGGGPGLSAYALAVERGFVGTLDQWLATLEGEPGDDGDDGDPGSNGLGNVTGYVWNGAAYVSDPDTRVYIGPVDPRTAPGGRDVASDLWIEDGTESDPVFVYGVGLDDPDIFIDVYGVDAIGIDQEFNRSGQNALPAGWTWANQGPATFNELAGAAVIASPAAASINARVVKRAVPGLTTWACIAKHLFVGSQVTDAAHGLVLRESGTGKLLTLGYYVTGTAHSISVHTWAGPNGVLALQGSSLSPAPMGNPPYKRIVKEGTNLYSFYVSWDGRGWMPVLVGLNTTGVTYNEIGFFGHAVSGAFTDSLEWMRFR